MHSNVSNAQGNLNHRHRVARRVRHDHGDMLRCGIGLNMSAAVLLQPPDRADANLANGAVQRQREVQRLGPAIRPPMGTDGMARSCEQCWMRVRISRQSAQPTPRIQNVWGRNAFK